MVYIGTLQVYMLALSKLLNAFSGPPLAMIKITESRNAASVVKAMKEEHPDLSSYLMTVDKPITWNQSVVAENFGISQMFFNDQWVNDEKVGSRKKLGDVSFMKQIVAKAQERRNHEEGKK